MFYKIFFQLGLKFASIFFSLLISRWLISNFDASVFKEYTVITYYNGIILMAITLGLPTIIQRYYTKHHDTSALGNFWTTFSWLRFGSYFLGIFILALCYPLIGSNNILAILVLFTAQFVLLSDNSYRSIVDSQNRSWQFSMTDLLGKALLFGLILIGSWYLKLSLVQFAVISLIAYLIAFLADVLWQKSQTSPGKFDTKILKAEIAAIGFLSLTDFVTASYLKTDVPFLNFLHYSDSQIVSYSSAYKLFEIASVIPGLAIPVLASKLKRKLDSQDYQDAGKWSSVFKQMILVTGLGLGLTIITYFLAGVGAWLIDPKNLYPDIVTYLRQLSPILTLLFPVILANDLINLSGLEKYQLVSKVITAVFCISLYIMLIPTLGPVGAVYATIGAYCLELIVKGWFVFKYVR